MSAAFQSRVQLLAVLLIVFTLLSLPLFNQVREDVDNSGENAKSTLLSKMFSKIAKSFQGDPPDDLQIDDAWARYQEENPCTGQAECNPDGDLDGDGVSNKDELAQGRNPSCNEEVEGKEYCEGLDPPGPDPDNKTLPELVDILYEQTNLSAGWEERFEVPLVAPEYDLWDIQWSVRDYQGVSFQLEVRDMDGELKWSYRPDILENPEGGEDQLTEDSLPPSGADYRFLIVDQPSVAGNWDILIKGVRFERPAP